MGHYDDQYEAMYAKQRAQDRAMVEAIIKEKLSKGLRILPFEKFWPKGVCPKCGDTVYVIPNWGCKKGCPYVPGDGVSYGQEHE